MGYIYCIENKINHKKYIGQTKHSVNRRFYMHCHDHINDGTVLHNAMKAYGIDNFFVTTLLECANEELNEKEREYIIKNNTHWRDGYGYNMSYGGENSPDVLEKPVAAYKLDENFNIIQETRQVFKSLKEAERKLSNNKQQVLSCYISQICNGKKFSVFGYTFCFVDSNNNDVPTNYQGIKGSVNASKQNVWKAIKANSYPTVLVDLNNNCYYYNSINEINDKLHICPRTIRNSIDNKQPIKGGKYKGWQAYTIEEYEAQFEQGD